MNHYKQCANSIKFGAKTYQIMGRFTATIPPPNNTILNINTHIPINVPFLNGPDIFMEYEMKTDFEQKQLTVEKEIGNSAEVRKRTC